jgi:hypothetical protein
MLGLGLLNGSQTPGSLLGVSPWLSSLQDCASRANCSQFVKDSPLHLVFDSKPLLFPVLTWLLAILEDNLLLLKLFLMSYQSMSRFCDDETLVLLMFLWYKLCGTL